MIRTWKEWVFFMSVMGRYDKKSLPLRIFGTIMCIVLYRAMSSVPLPYVNGEYIRNMFGSDSSLGMLNLLTGGNLSQMSIAALGISPYITASIFLQLASVLIPSLAALQKDGFVGQKKFQQVTVILSCFIAVFSGAMLIINYRSAGLLISQEWYATVIPICFLVGSSTLLSLLGKLIDDHLFGNGISLFLLAGIVCNLPSSLSSSITTVRSIGAVSGHEYLSLGLFIALLLVMFVFTCWMYACELRLPLMYSHKAVTNMDIVEDSSVLPLKMLSSSVMPVIFASSVLAFPSLVQLFLGKQWVILRIFNTQSWLKVDDPFASIGIVIYFGLIFFFSRYSQTLNVNEVEVSDNLRKSGCVIKGVAQGRETELYLKDKFSKLNTMGSFCLCLVSFLPILFSNVFGIGSIALLGTSLILIVSIVQDTWYNWKVEHKGQSYLACVPVLSTTRRNRDSDFCLLERAEV